MLFSAGKVFALAVVTVGSVVGRTKENFNA